MSETKGRDFPGGPGVKNPPANAGHMDLISGLGRSHMLWSSEVHTPGGRAPQQEEPPQRAACALRPESSPALSNQRQPTCSSEGPAQPETVKYVNQSKI